MLAVDGGEVGDTVEVATTPGSTEPTVGSASMVAGSPSLHAAPAIAATASKPIALWRMCRRCERGDGAEGVGHSPCSRCVGVSERMPSSMDATERVGHRGKCASAEHVESVGDESGELGSVVDAELLEGVHDVRLDGPAGDVKLLADLAIGQTIVRPVRPPDDSAGDSRASGSSGVRRAAVEESVAEAMIAATPASDSRRPFDPLAGRDSRTGPLRGMSSEGSQGRGAVQRLLPRRSSAAAASARRRSSPPGIRWVRASMASAARSTKPLLIGPHQRLAIRSQGLLPVAAQQRRITRQQETGKQHPEQR